MHRLSYCRSPNTASRISATLWPCAASSIVFANSMLRWLVRNMPSVSRLRRLSSTSETIPEKKSRQTILRNPIVTLLRIPVI